MSAGAIAVLYTSVSTACRSEPLVVITLTQADLDRLDGLGVPIEVALGALDVELQRVLGLSWLDIEIELHTDGSRALGHSVVERALLNLGR